MSKNLDWIFSEEVKAKTEELFQDAKVKARELLSDKLKQEAYKHIRSEIERVTSKALSTYIKGQIQDRVKIQSVIEPMFAEIDTSASKLAKQLNSLGITVTVTDIRQQISDTLQKGLFDSIANTIERNLVNQISSKIADTIAITITSQTLSVDFQKLREQSMYITTQTRDIIRTELPSLLNNIRAKLSFQTRNSIQNNANNALKNITSMLQERIVALVGHTLSEQAKKQLQNIVSSTVSEIVYSVSDVIDDALRNLPIDTAIQDAIMQALNNKKIKQTITKSVDKTLTALVDKLVSETTDIVINSPNIISSAIKKIFNEELYAASINVSVFAFTQTNSYDLSTKVIQITTELEYGRLPVVTIRFAHLTNEELEVLTDKAAGITLHITDSENNVLFTIPTLLPTEIVNVSTAETRFKHVAIRYLPQWQFDMLYRQTVFFTINAGEQLSAKIRSFCSNRFIYIVDRESLNNITVNRTLQITNEPVIQVFKTLDSYYRIYRPDLYPNAQILIPYTAISLPIDGTESLITMILAPLEYRQFVYNEIIDKRPFFIKTLPAYDKETIDTKRLIEQFFDPKMDRIFMSLDGTQNMNQQFLAEAIKTSIHPEQFPTNDVYRGKLELVKTEENIDKYSRLSDEYRMIFGKGQHTLQHNFAEQLRQIFSQLSFPKVRLDSAFVPLDIEYYRSLPTMLPGIQVKYLLVNLLDAGRLDIQAGYGQLNRISWIWNRSGGKLSSGSIQLSDIEIKQVQTIQLE